MPGTDHVARDGSRWTLQRDPDESDDDYERRRQLLEAGGRIVIGVEELTNREFELLADSEIPEELRWHSDDLLADLGLTGVDAAVVQAKWELMRITALAIDEHGIALDDIAGEIGEAPAVLQSWLDGMVKDVSLDRLAALHHVIAERSNQWPLEWLIGGRPGSDVS